MVSLIFYARTDRARAFFLFDAKHGEKLFFRFEKKVHFSIPKFRRVEYSLRVTAIALSFRTLS